MDVEPASSDRSISIVTWCLQNDVEELHIFATPADEVRTWINEKVNWINVGRKAVRQPPLMIKFYGEIREQ